MLAIEDAVSEVFLALARVSPEQGVEAFGLVTSRCVDGLSVAEIPPLRGPAFAFANARHSRAVSVGMTEREKARSGLRTQEKAGPPRSG